MAQLEKGLQVILKYQVMKFNIQQKNLKLIELGLKLDRIQG